MKKASGWQIALMVCVPCVALVVVGRQFYLASHYGLSTWKGGGMGMFAAADELANRFAKVFLIDPDGNRDSLFELPADDADVLNRALEYPTRENFLRAARQIARENWIPQFQRRPVLKVNSEGDPVEALDKSIRLMVPSQLRPEKAGKKPGMEIQFWKVIYDPHTRHVRAFMAETFVFSPEELFQWRAAQRGS